MVFSLSLQTWPQFITIKTVKINRVSAKAENSELGPSPTVPAAGLSPAVAAVLDHLSAQAAPVSIGALSAMTGLHGNTVREHLDTLIASGLAAKEQALSQGRGRPAWLYFATDGAAATGAPEYAGLAAALAAYIHRTSDSPRGDGIAAGLEWGHQLAADFGNGGSGAGADNEASGAGTHNGTTAQEQDPTAQEQTLSLLDELGFAPAVDTADDSMQVRLTRCPLLSAAHQYPDIVCGVHLGLVRGAMNTFGDQDSDSQLEPFAEPGACRLRLETPKPGALPREGSPRGDRQ